jgi:Fic family protein
MEPLFPEASKHLSDLATDLVARSNALAGRLHPVIQEGIGDLVRSMNCYYSNLIEGHHTHPVDIDKALAGDYSAERERRNLQLEARAHIDVQRKIDAGSAPRPSTSTGFIRWVHRELCKQLPEEFLVVSDPKTGREEKVVPGDLRNIPVKVGQHIPLPPMIWLRCSIASSPLMATTSSPKSNASLAWQRRTIACCGFTRSLTAMAG